MMFADWTSPYCENRSRRSSSVDEKGRFPTYIFLLIAPLLLEKKKINV
jgi:hypothetical protein